MIKRLLTCILAASMFWCAGAHACQKTILVKYGTAGTFDFTLFETDGVNFKEDATFSAGDVLVMIDEAAESQASTHSGTPDFSTLVTDEGTGYSVTYYAEDATGARIVWYFKDQGTKTWLDTCVECLTYGNASAQYEEDGAWTATEKEHIRYRMGVDGDTSVPVSNGPHLTVDLEDDAIKASKYDESTAFPLASADSGATEVARTGADGDTLEDLSDQIDGISLGGDWSATEKEHIRYRMGVDGDTSVPVSNGPHLTVDLEDDAIKASKYDESTAFPLASADTGATQVARTGADGDTLEDLSDQIDIVSAGPWTSAEKGQIRYRLGIDGTTSAPVSNGPNMSDEIYEGTMSHKDFVRLFGAVLLGKSDGNDTATHRFRDIGDSKWRLTVTYDGNGDRETVTRDPD